MHRIHTALAAWLGILSFVSLGSAAGPTVSVEGFTEPYRKVEVASAETGTVASILVHEGDRVVEGQPLATLDNDVLAVTLEIAKANLLARGKLDMAAAECDVRRQKLERLMPLLKDGNATQEEVDRARADVAVADASLLAAREQQQVDQLECKRTEAMIERRTMRSPISGIVVKVHKDQREFISVASAAIATIVQIDPLRVVFSAPTAIGAKLAAGRVVSIRFPDTATVATAKVEYVAPITDAESGTVRLKLRLENPDGKYRSGIRCTLDLKGLLPDEKPAKPLTAGVSHS